MTGSLNVPMGTFASRYSVERELGRGATATVYLARDTLRGRQVAIKVLRPELAQSVGVDRFLREIRISEKLHHPHIVPVLDSGESDGQLFFVLPHMEEGSLRQVLQKEKQLSMESALAITRNIADALDYAHRQGLIHRDVKPENILFTSGQACLADFGIARAIERAIDESTTSTGLVRGTPAYMSPEQASGSTSYDGRSDVYSLALVFYEMLAGMPAFIGPTPESVIGMRFVDRPRKLTAYRRDISAGIQSVIDKSLSLVPADRYESAGALADALANAVHNPIVEPRTSGPSLSPPRSMRLALAGAVIFAIALGSAGMWYGEMAERRAAASDTLRIAVLPPEADSGLSSQRVHDMVHQAFAEWKPIRVASLFEIQDAIGSDGPPEGLDAAQVSMTLRAGNYVRSRLSRSGDSLVLHGALHRVTRSQPVSQASITLPADLADAGALLQRFVRRLLIDDPRADTVRSFVLPAVQHYLRAEAAREALDLAAADSALVQALTADPAMGQAALMLAQVRTWRHRPAAEWRPWVARALTSGALSPSERRMASGLAAMSTGLVGHDCSLFDELTRAAPRDFGVWYTKATCLVLDSAVVSDLRSPIRWRFRSSYQRAIDAYLEAFALAPAMHRSFQPGAFAQLRKLMFADILLRSGISLDERERFLAYPSWDADSLLFVPHLPSDLGKAGGSVIESARLAVANQRRLMAGVAKTWAAALPDNPNVKEAVAVSLELLGDRRGLDTLVEARRLATNSTYRATLAATEFLFRLGQSRAAPDQIAVAYALGDSLLAAHPQPPREIAAALAPVAAFLGRCETAGRLSAASNDPLLAERFGISQGTYSLADSLTVVTAMGCRHSLDEGAMSAIENDLARSSVDDRTKPMLSSSMLSRLVRLSVPFDSTRGRRLATGFDYVLQAKLAIARDDGNGALSVLEERRRVRGTGGNADISADALLAEAQVWLALGDSATAREWVRAALERPSWLSVLNSPVEAGALMQLVALYAELCDHFGAYATARAWAALPAALWSEASGDLVNRRNGFVRILNKQ